MPQETPTLEDRELSAQKGTLPDSPNAGPPTGPDFVDSPDPAKALLGRVLKGQYVISSVLGQGAMGLVFRGTQRGLEKVVAIKVMHLDGMHTREWRDRFEREATAVSKMASPGECKILSRWTAARTKLTAMTITSTPTKPVTTAMRDAWLERSPSQMADISAISSGVVNAVMTIEERDAGRATPSIPTSFSQLFNAGMDAGALEPEDYQDEGEILAKRKKAVGCGSNVAPDASTLSTLRITRRRAARSRLRSHTCQRDRPRSRASGAGVGPRTSTTSPTARAAATASAATRVAASATRCGSVPSIRTAHTRPTGG